MTIKYDYFRFGNVMINCDWREYKLSLYCSCFFIFIVMLFYPFLIFFCDLLRMKFISAYLLATLAGNPNPSAEDLTTILESGSFTG